MAVGSKILQNTLARAKYGRRGKVHYNGQRAKPSKSVEIGAQITLRQGHDEKTIIIERSQTNAVGHLKHNSSIAKRPKASPNVNAMP